MTTDDTQLQAAIDALLAKVRAGGDPAPETAALRQLVAQWRGASEQLQLATVKAQVLQEDADRRNRRQNEFLAMLAHELRNPMAPISNAAQLLDKIQTAHPLLPKVQEIIQRQVDQMVSLLDDLLDASSIASGQVVLQRRIVPLQDIVRQAVEMTRPLMEKRQQRFDADAVPLGLLVDADVARLAQALANLLENASTYTHEKGRIALRVHATPNAVALRVQDDGRGIEARLLPHVFDLFVQGPRTLDRGEGGLGIGLAVAKGITEMHGGRIAVTSEGAGRGASFEITLPLAAGRSDAGRVELTDAEHAPGGCSILIVEDNADLVSTLVTILELEGHHVMTAVDGITGLALAKSRSFDVIICDIGLPGLDGYGLIAQVRQHAAERQPYAIAISGYSQTEDRDRALAAGFDHYVTKPLRGTNLLRLIAARPAD